MNTPFETRFETLRHFAGFLRLASGAQRSPQTARVCPVRQYRTLEVNAGALDDLNAFDGGTDRMAVVE